MQQRRSNAAILGAIIGCVLLYTSSAVRQSDWEHRLVALTLLNDVQPGDLHTLTHIATTLHRLDHDFPDGGSRVPAAVKAYREALEICQEPTICAALHSNLGALLMSSGSLLAAVNELEVSILLYERIGKPATAELAGTMFNKGKALGMIGHHSESQQIYRKAQQAAYATAPGVWLKCWAALKNITDQDMNQMLGAATVLLSSKGVAAKYAVKFSTLSPSKAANLHKRWDWLIAASLSDCPWLFFALYNAYDKKEMFKEAWSYLGIANTIQKDIHPAEPSHSAQLLNAVVSAFPQPRADVRGGVYEYLIAGEAGHRDASPIFIVGMPRSGSTLLEQILASHPGVVGAGEDTALAPLISQLFEALEGDSGQVSSEKISGIGKLYVEKMKGKLALGTKATYVVDKMLRNAWNIGYIAMVLPQAHIIWAVRHPMDVLLSCYAQAFEGRGISWAWDLQEITEEIELTHAIMEHWELVLPGRILRMPYEHVVHSQENASRTLLQHCGVEWDPMVLHFHKTARDVQTASLSQVRKKLYASSVGRWTTYKEQLQPFKQRMNLLIAKYENALHQMPRKGYAGKNEL